jgi:hypothetical protein
MVKDEVPTEAQTAVAKVLVTEPQVEQPLLSASLQGLAVAEVRERRVRQIQQRFSSQLPR